MNATITKPRLSEKQQERIANRREKGEKLISIANDYGRTTQRVVQIHSKFYSRIDSKATKPSNRINRQKKTVAKK